MTHKAAVETAAKHKTTKHNEDVSDDDNAKPASKSTRAKAAKLAAEDEDAKPAHKAASKLRTARLAADDDDRATPVKKSAKSKVELADADDAPVKTTAKTRAGKKAELALAAKAKTAKGKSAKATGSDDDADTIVKTVVASVGVKPVNADIKLPAALNLVHPAKTVKAAVPVKVPPRPSFNLAAVTQALMNVPQSLFNPPAPVVMARAPALNAAPVPYTRIATSVPPAPTGIGALNSGDAQLYQAAFTQIDHGDYDDAEATLAQTTDKSLMGYAEYHKLFSGGYSASYDELTGWMTQYGDQPMAMKVWALAKRKKPQGAPDPAFPSLAGNQAIASADDNGNGVRLSGSGAFADTAPVHDVSPGAPTIDTSDSDLTPKSARSAYNNGQMEQAIVLARKVGDHWVAGLANWRLKRFDAALTEFKFVSTDPTRNAWSQASGAYWAARCAEKMDGGQDQAQTFYKIAASFPFTFYGLLAETKLGVTPAVILAKQGQAPTFQPEQRGALTAGLDNDFSWAKGNVQAQRLSALVQIGRGNDAQDEVKSAVQRANDDTERDHWLALAAYNHVDVNQLRTSDRLFDASIYPTPAYKLKGGYQVDRALLYAFARKESKFNASAKSYAGAYGLLQLMPGTAAMVENDSSFTSKPSQLLKPAVNMRVGQHYMQKLLDSKIVNGDLLRLIAAYNGGPRPVKDATDSLGQDADSLLLMESIPVAQTRQYVEEVAANYWIYRQIMGKSSKTLVQAASDSTIIDASLDN